MQYDLYIEHIDGLQNKVADCLSRIAEELTVEEVKDVPEAEDKAEFPVTLYSILHKSNNKRQSGYLQSEPTKNSNAVPTKQNLSCSYVLALSVLDDYRYSKEQLMEAQRNCPELKEAIDLLENNALPSERKIESNWYLKNGHMRDGLLAYQFEGCVRTVAPKSLREKLLYQAHT